MGNVYEADELSGWRYGMWLLRTRGVGVFREKLSEAIRLWIIVAANRMLGQRRPAWFEIFGKEIEYLSDHYNKTWINERSVEVPLGLWLVNNFKKKKVLEVGAVLGHYVNPEWDVLDKFEKGKGIINEDIVGFKPTNKYDLVVSVSTLEHVGWDDDIRDAGKTVEAIESIKKHCLSKGGTFVATMPIGYNKGMDDALFKGKLGFDDMKFMKRISIFNEWKEVTLDEARGAKYCWPYNNGNVIVVGQIGASVDDL